MPDEPIDTDTSAVEGAVTAAAIENQAEDASTGQNTSAPSDAAAGD